MSQLFGSVQQLGFVVRDIETAMRHWTQVMRIGPFYYLERMPVMEFRFRGEPREIACSIALAYSGNVQIKLLQMRNDVPSAYRNFVAAGHEGLHHIASLTEHYDRDLQRAIESGLQVEQQGVALNAQGRFTGFASTGHPGTAYELIALDSDNRNLFEMVRRESAHWDGSGPVRQLDL